MLVLSSVTPLLFGAKDVNAQCDPWTPYSIEKSNKLSVDRNNIGESTGDSDGTITIQCSGGYPTGWSTVRSGSTFIKKTSKNTKIYRRYGGKSQASYDFFRTIAPDSSYRKYMKHDGSITYVKYTPEGNVIFYKSKQSYPSLNFADKEKIHYP